MGATNYDAMTEELMADPAVTRGKLFGHACLKTGGKVFACDYEGELLTKLPPERIDELKAAGAQDFNPMGRKMNGWVLVAEPDADPIAVWTDLAEEAKAFVAEASA